MFIRNKVVSVLLVCISAVAVMANPAGAALSHGKFSPLFRSASAIRQQMAISYQIKDGDTLWDIARKYDVDLTTLLNLNGLNDNSILHIGQSIKIPSQHSPLHIISSGETLWDIAALYNCSVAELQSLNPAVDAECLKIGDSLILPRGKQPVLAMKNVSRGIGFSSFISWPIMGTITSYFGWRSLGYHFGVDIAASLGDPVQAAADGVVSFAGWKGNYGKVIFIDHSGGRRTVYGHLSKILVQNGQRISRGQVIGKIGVTGRTTGPHLHFEVREKGRCMNPLRYLKS